MGSIRGTGGGARSDRWRSDVGQVFVIFAFVLPALLGLSAIVVDVGNVYFQKRTVRAAADAAALAAAIDLNKAACSIPGTAQGDPCVALSTGKFSGLNNGIASLTSLQKCPGNGNGNCYTWPYNGNTNKVEVKLKKSVPTFFARIFGIGTVAVSGRAVASVSPGRPPPYTFVALNNASCPNPPGGGEKHTLLVRLGGQLTVTGGIYANSCSDDDGFDIFGAEDSSGKTIPGNITAPVIQVVGGWETKNESTVTVTGTVDPKNSVVCPRLTDGNPPQPADPKCPKILQPVLADPFGGRVVIPTLGSPACLTAINTITTAAYIPAQQLNANITAAATTFKTKLNPTVIAVNDIIQIQNERMRVDAVVANTLTVTRGWLGTTAVAHKAGKAGKISKVIITTTSAGTAANPAACELSTGTSTINPGTYYGGICIGTMNGTSCDTDCDTGDADVTMNPGTYIIAGGGFWVCGDSILRAPNVMIYNTYDPSQNTGSGAFNRLELNTSGSVTLGPQTLDSNPGTPYPGLTIFQDRTKALIDAKCDGRATPAEWDIALVQMASVGSDANAPNGALGSISGTIYAPHQHAVFADSVSGRANLAIFTGCIYIDGGDSTFDFKADGLFGTGSSIDE